MVHGGRRGRGVEETVPSFLADENLQLLAFGGKGGVGKTTCAAAAALYLSDNSPGRRCLVLSTDPAHSLLDSLDDLSLPDNLTSEEIDTGSSLNTFRRKHGDTLRRIASRGTFLDDEDIDRFLGLSLPGLDEIMAFMEILDRVNANSYDTIVMDTAPTGHTVRLLQMPGFLENWLRAMDALLGKHRYMKRLFSGAYQSDDVDRFIIDLSESMERMNSFLRDPRRYRFVPVMLAEKLSVDETAGLLDFLAGAGMPFHEILVNRLVPENDCPVCIRARARQIRELTGIEGRTRGATLWGIPLFPDEPTGSRLREIFKRPPRPITFPLPAPPRLPSLEPAPVEWSGTPLDPGKKKLLLFGGKGGVGKTTLSCATAVHLSQTPGKREVLLFSTDPAHSLSACLDVDVGAVPARVCPGLTAVGIDGVKEFDTLKDQYSAELENFLMEISPNLDLTFDREVMERVMDLSPPGLDEVMALTMAMEFMDDGSYDILVMDGAPSGHFIRLLEMPELIERWLKAFFNLFLKYKRIFRLPGISGRLVKLSKDLKKFRRLLSSPDDACVVAVSILTRMAFEETGDLLESCARLGVDVPVVLLNMATPKSSCSLCSTRFRHETVVRNDFRRAWPGISQALIYSRNEPRGVEALAKLGKGLYEPHVF